MVVVRRALWTRNNIEQVRISDMIMIGKKWRARDSISGSAFILGVSDRELEIEVD